MKARALKLFALFSSAVLIIGLWAGVPPQVSALETGEIAGTVRYGTAGAQGPTMTGVSVAVLGTGHSTVTGANGAYSLQTPPGQYTVRFSKDGYAVMTHVVNVVQGQQAVLNAQTALLGDVNLDGFVNAADIVPINRHALGIELIVNELSLAVADVNRDTFVNAADIVPVNRHALGIELLAGGDTTPPRVVSLVPALNAVDVVRDTSLSVTFDENITAVAGKNLYLCKASDDAVVYTIIATNTVVVGSVVTFTPVPSLDFSTAYYVQIDAGAFRDIAGNSYEGMSDKTTWAFTTVAAGPVGILTPDQPLSEANLNGRTLTLALVDDTFTADDAVVVERENLLLKNAPPGLTLGALSFIPNGGTIELLFDGTDFDADTAISLEIKGAELASGQDLTTQPLTISALNDAESLEVIWRTPPGTSGAQLTMNSEVLSLAISGGHFVPENLNQITLSGTAVTEAGISLKSGQAFTLVNRSTVDIALSWDGTAYGADKTLTITVPPAAYRDSTGQGALTVDLLCPGDKKAPQAVGFIPLRDALAVPINTTLSVTFDEQVVAVAGKSINIRKAADDTIAFSIAADSVTLNNNVISFTPAPNLSYNTSYYVTIDAGAFRDRAGNNYVGITDKTIWTYTSQIKVVEGQWITISAQDLIPHNNFLLLTSSEPLTNASWGAIVAQIRSNTQGGLNWITGGEGLTAAHIFAANISADGLTCELSNTSGNNATINHDFVISAANIIGRDTGPAQRDIIIDACSDPQFAASYPRMGPIGNTLLAKVSKTGKVYYVALPSGSPDPTPAQIRSGQDAAGVPAAISGHVNIPSFDTETAGSIAGLTAEANYDLHVVAEDSKGNLQLSAVRIAMTAAPTPGEVTVDFSHPIYAISTTGLTPAKDYELRLKDGSWLESMTNGFGQIMLTPEQLEALVAQGADTLQVRVKAAEGKPASGREDLAVVTVGTQPVGIGCHAGADDLYGTYDEKLVGCLANTDYLVNIAGQGWVAKPSGPTGEITSLTIAQSSTTVEVRLAGTGTRLPSPVLRTAGRQGILMPDQPLTEQNLHGRVLTLTLERDTFAGEGAIVVLPANVVLQNAPHGLTLGNMSFTAQGGTLQLLFKGADFDFDIAINLLIKGEELTSGVDLVTQAAIITATNDPESLQVTWDNPPGTNGEQATMDSEYLQVVISGGHFVEANLKDIYLSGTAVSLAGIRLGSPEPFELTDSSTVHIAIDWDGTGYSEDKTLTINVPGTAYRDSTGAGTLTFDLNCPAPGVRVTATPAQPLTEANLDGHIINLELVGCSFVDNNLDKNNFTLINAPLQLVVSQVQWIDATHASLTLTYPGWDFDLDITNFCLTIAAGEVSSGQPLTTNTMTITAHNDPESLSLAWYGLPGTNGAKATMDSEVIEVTISGGYLDVAQVNQVYLSGTAVTEAGISLRAFTGWSATNTKLRISLAWDGTDYDTDKTLTVHVPITAYRDSHGNDELTASIICPANPPDRVATLSAVDGLPLTEQTLLNRQLKVVLEGDTRAHGDVGHDLFTAHNLPPGLSLIITGSDIGLFNLRLTPTVNQDIPDFDSNYNNFYITIGGAALTSGEDLVTNTLPIIANNDLESISLEWSQLGGVESTMNNEYVVVTHTGGQFIEAAIGDIFLSGTALDVGIRTEAVVFNSKTQVTIYLAWDGSDYNSDKVLTVNVPTSAYVDSTGGGALTASLTCHATGKEVTIVPDKPLLESNLSGLNLNVTLDGHTFKGAIRNEGNFVLNNAPPRLVVQQVIHVSPTQATVHLFYDGDFDSNIEDFSLTILGDEILPSHDRISNSLTLIAVDDPERLLVGWSKKGAMNTMNDESISVMILGGSFNAEALNLVTVGGTLFDGTGITVESIALNSYNMFTINLNWDGTPYEGERTVTIDIPSNTYFDSSGIDLSVSITTGVGLIPISTSPLEYSHNAPLDTDIVMTFARNVTRGSGFIECMIREPGQDDVYYDLNIKDTEHVLINGNVVTIPNLQLLPYDTLVNIRINFGALCDADGVTNGYIWYFYTAPPPGPEVLSAVTSADGSKVLLTFSRAMAEPNPENVTHEFFWLWEAGEEPGVGGNALTVTDIVLNPLDNKVIVLTLQRAVLPGRELTLNYQAGGRLQGADGTVVDGFDNLQAINNRVP